MRTMPTFLTAVIVIVSMLLSAHPGSAQSTPGSAQSTPGSAQSTPGSAQSSEELKALRKELEAIKEGQGRLQKDVQEIKAILQGGRMAAPPPQVQPQNVVLALDGAPVKGDKNARVVLVEFTDYHGTPAFFIGVGDGATVKVVRVIKGAMPFPAFKEAIDAALAVK